MRSDFWFDSCGKGKIHCCKWTPDGEAVGVVQIVHGIAEFVERYQGFAEYLNGKGYIVVAEDHMGHGLSINNGGIRGYFHGGWFAAIDDSCKLMTMTMAEYPDLPYVLFGHSMGSFMARTILCRNPNSGIRAAVICGTGWQPRAALPAVIKICEAICRRTGETNPNETLQNVVFGSYNKKVEHQRTAFDWLSRDNTIVDSYIAHPLCGFTASCGLLRDMMKGIRYVEDPKNLKAMKKDLPVLFIAGGDDPVGSYGKGVRQAAAAFASSGMKDVSTHIYPLARHEILNEINKTEVYSDVYKWISQKTEI